MLCRPNGHFKMAMLLIAPAIGTRRMCVKLFATMVSMNRWVKQREELVYDGYRKILRRTFTLPNGKTSDFDVVQSNGGAAVLALTDEQKILCFRQFRPGPEEILYELPGGGIRSGEDIKLAVQRELKEETGYEADIELIGSYYRDAYVTGKWPMFVGRHAHKVSGQSLEDTEYGDLLLLTVDEFKEKLFAGLMTDTTLGYAGLRYLGLL